MIEWIGVNCGSLEGMGFSGRVIGFIRAAYEGLCGEVKVGEVLSESF